MRNARVAVADQDLEQLSSIFRLLADKTRLSILMILADGERNVTSLCEVLNLPQPTVSHHLGLLRIYNVIGNRRQGKQVFYNLSGMLSSQEGTLFQVSVENYQIRVRPKAGHS